MARRMKAPGTGAADPKGGGAPDIGLTKEHFISFLDSISATGQAVRDAASEHGTEWKRAKTLNVHKGAARQVDTLRRQDMRKAAEWRREFNRYCDWCGIGTQTGLFDNVVDHPAMSAKARGEGAQAYRDGKTLADSNTYTGTASAAAFESGFLEAEQIAIAEAEGNGEIFGLSEAKASGLKAGRAGANQDTCPFPVDGTDAETIAKRAGWLEQWLVGQAELAQSLEAPGRGKRKAKAEKPAKAAKPERAARGRKRAAPEAPAAAEQQPEGAGDQGAGEDVTEGEPSGDDESKLLKDAVVATGGRGKRKASALFKQ